MVGLKLNSETNITNHINWLTMVIHQLLVGLNYQTVPPKTEYGNLSIRWGTPEVFNDLLWTKTNAINWGTLAPQPWWG